jgi:hypothetical protein
MSKKNKLVRIKLIANPGAGDVSKSVSRIEQVMHYLSENGLKVDLALARPKKKPSP